VIKVVITNAYQLPSSPRYVKVKPNSHCQSFSRLVKVTSLTCLVKDLLDVDVGSVVAKRFKDRFCKA
jgi:hypothetical protein